MKSGLPWGVEAFIQIALSIRIMSSTLHGVVCVVFDGRHFVEIKWYT